MRICTKCKEPKEDTEFYINTRKDGKIHSWCKVCIGKDPVTRGIENRRKAIELLGGKCSSCGYSKCPAALEFHHIDPKEKSFTVSQKRHRSWKNVEREVKKCILLCANCHREKEVELRLYRLKEKALHF